MLVNTDIFKADGIVKSLKDCVGMIIDTDLHGKVKLVEFKEEPSWGGQVNFYLDKYHKDNIVATHLGFIGLTGGAFLVEYVD